MSRGRIIDFVFLIVGLFLILTSQYVGIVIMDETRETVLDTGIDMSEFNGEEHINRIYTVVTKWVPTVAGLGLIFLTLYREYRRQRRAAIVGQAGGPPL